MENQSGVGPTTPDPSSAPPPMAAPSAAAAPPPDAYGAATYQTPPPAPPKKSSAGKWIIGILLVLLIITFGLCAVSFVALGEFGSMPTTGGESIALIHVDGVIAGTGGGVNGTVTPERMISLLDEAAADPSIKAVLLRIDSPGGTVAASQEISIEIERFEKPIVASIGDVGASGAYMIASQCDLIVATPTSAIGSIGVIAQIPNIEGLLEKFGIEFTTLTAGEYKGAGSMYRSLTETETRLILHGIDIAYEEFIRIVAEGRDLPEDEVREMATGWAWSAIEAQEMGLVDELGTYSDAVDATAELAGIEGEPQVIVYDEYDYGSFLSLLLGIQDSLDRLGTLTPSGETPAPVVPQ